MADMFDDSTMLNTATESQVLRSLTRHFIDQATWQKRDHHRRSFPWIRLSKDSSLLQKGLLIRNSTVTDRVRSRSSCSFCLVTKDRAWGSSLSKRASLTNAILSSTVFKQRWTDKLVEFERGLAMICQSDLNPESCQISRIHSYNLYL